MFFYPLDISQFHSFGRPWGANLDPCGKSVILTGARKIHIKVVYVFFTHQTFSIFIPLAVPWGSNLGPCCNNVILTGAREIHIKVVYVFFTHQTFPIFIPLVVPWGSNLDPCGKNVILTGARKIHIKVVYGFYPSDVSQFHSFSCPFGSQLGSLLQKCDPERCSRNSHKSRLCFFAHQTFSIFIPLAVPWCPNLDPCCKNVILTGARKTHIKIVSVFLPIRHFPVSFLWLSLGVPTWILAAKV